jgi:primase-polymerase (primpol)-like protein
MQQVRPKPYYTLEELLTAVSANFPAELQEKPYFCLWKYEWVKDKWTKVCYQTNGRPARSNDRKTWTTLRNCLGIYIQGKFDGIGCFIAEPYIGVDFDRVRDKSTGAIEPWASTALKQLNSYAELSPSATGFHVWLTGKLPDNRWRRRGRVEIYESGRYFTVTGGLL